MSPCNGIDCTHPECQARPAARPTAEERREQAAIDLGFNPAKWAVMNRAERRAAARAVRRR